MHEGWFYSNERRIRIVIVACEASFLKTFEAAICCASRNSPQLHLCPKLKWINNQPFCYCEIFRCENSRNSFVAQRYCFFDLAKFFSVKNVFEGVFL